MDPTAFLILGSVTAFFAGLTHGLTGFGVSIVFVSIMVLVLPPAVVVPTVLFLAIAINISVCVEARRWIDLRRIWPLMIAGVAGLPFGAYLLLALPPHVLKIAIGVVITAFAILFYKGLSWRIRNERRAFVFVGLMSGLLNASAGMSGPPVILFFTNQGMEKNTFRANIVIYFLVVNIFSLSIFAYKGLVTARVLHFAAVFLAALFLGGLTGIRLTRRLDEKLFRNIALFIVIVAGVLAVASGIRSFL